MRTFVKYVAAICSWLAGSCIYVSWLEGEVLRGVVILTPLAVVLVGWLWFTGEDSRDPGQDRDW